MNRIVAAVALLAASCAAFAQSSPNLVRGFVPTAPQWNSYFAAKLDYQASGIYTGIAAVGPLKNPLIINLNSGAPSPINGQQPALQITGIDGGSALATIDSYGAQSTLFFRRAAGSAASPTAISSGDPMGAIGWRGYNGVSWTTGNVVSTALIQASATENFSNTNQGTQLDIYTTPTGTAARAKVATFGQDGSLSLTASANNNPSILTSGATTGYSYIGVLNGSGGGIIGVEGATPGALINGDSAYDMTVRNNSSNGIAFSANSGGAMQMRLSTTALDFGAGIKARTANNSAFASFDSGAVSRDLMKLDGSNQLIIGAAAAGIGNIQFQIAGTAIATVNGAGLTMNSGNLVLQGGGGTGIVSVQGVDTCGAGFRCLRIPN